MKYAGNTICLLAAAVALCGCSRAANWFHKQDMNVEGKYAADRVIEPAHPVGASYYVDSTAGPRTQLSMLFSRKGMARVLEPGNGRDKKTLLDYKKQLLIKKDYNTNWEESIKLDPYAYPTVLDAKHAELANAVCLGSGISKGYAYHRWGIRGGANEWEVWTDDKDNFPIYYRAIKNGEVTTWTIVSSWIDGSTYDRQTFFSLLPDLRHPNRSRQRKNSSKKPQRKPGWR